MAENDPGVLDQLKAYFYANDPNLAANLKLRERIALAQMTRRSAYPKTFGEGLASIGDSLSDAWMARSLDKEDAAAAKSASGYTGPPAAAAPSRSYAPEDANTVVPAARPQAQPVTPPLLPAVPLPQDQQQSDEPGAPVRMPSAAATQDWRNATPLPSIARPPVPPQQPPPTARAVAPPPPLPPAETAPAPPFGPGGRFGAASPGQQSAAQPPPGTPVMAEGNEPSSEEMNAGRNALAQALMQQQAARGGPQPLPTTRAVTPPPAGGEPQAAIRTAPQSAPVQAMPEQPGAVAGWVPAPANTQPRTAPTVPMSTREAELTRALGIAIQRNPYMAQSPAAAELAQLQRDREARQKDADKLFEAQIARDTKQQELHLTSRVDQAKRIEDARKSRLEQQQIQQGLIDGGGGGQQATDPRLLGTPQSPQRSGRAKVDPVPEGAIPEVWVKDQQAKIAKTADTLESAKPELAEALSLINKVETHPMKEASLGTLGGLAKLSPEGRGFAAMMEQLGGKNFLAGYQKLRGTGQISEIEGLKTEQAQARLTTAQNKEQFDDALKDLKSSMRGAVERVERKLNRPVTAYQKTPDDPYAPDVGQIGTRGGKTVEYIGGDPSQDSSYKTVRR